VRSHRLALLAVVGLTVFPALSTGQGYGEGLGVGGVFLPVGDSATILVTSRLGEATALEFGLALDVVSDDDYDSTDFGVSGGIRQYWFTERSFQPFYGGRLSLLHRTINDSEDTAFGLEGLLGGEYFLARNVSMLGEVGFGVFFGSLELRTGSRLAAFLYL
jgi:hypothetical protein